MEKNMDKIFRGILGQKCLISRIRMQINQTRADSCARCAYQPWHASTRFGDNLFSTGNHSFPLIGLCNVSPLLTITFVLSTNRIRISERVRIRLSRVFGNKECPTSDKWNLTIAVLFCCNFASIELINSKNGGAQRSSSRMLTQESWTSKRIT